MDDKFKEKWGMKATPGGDVIFEDGLRVDLFDFQTKLHLVTVHNACRNLDRVDLIPELIEDISDLAEKYGDGGISADTEDFHFAMIGVLESARLIKGGE